MQEISYKPPGIVLDKLFTMHAPPGFHPESPSRIESLIKFFEQCQPEVVYYPMEKAERSDLMMVHTEEHISYVESRHKQALKTGRASIDPDTWVSPDSLECVYYSIGSIFNLADALFKKEINSAFAMVRPPGHHALTYKSKGFCLFNNIALLARYILNNYSVKRIAIVDFDVHHGNGTQQVFYHCKEVLTISLHQYPFWPPRSGWYDETGQGKGSGYNINIPLVAGSGDNDYYLAFNEVVLPALNQFEPEFIIFAAGYDAHRADPVGDLNLSSAMYGSLIQMVANLDRSIPLFCHLEGGYDNAAMFESILFSLNALHNKTDAADAAPFSDVSDSIVLVNNDFFNKTKEVISSYWQIY
jgi:acetoin utilization deacetylase AcuC-like enzyme